MGIIFLVTFRVIKLAAIFLGAILVDEIEDGTGNALPRR
jgi:hypothetical protein